MISPNQSRAILSRHATEIASLRLVDLCSDDDRVTSMVMACNNDDDERMLLVDFSRQRMVRPSAFLLVYLFVFDGYHRRPNCIFWNTVFRQ